jgi:predicted NUDIX family NTP pyrophosphohydrolase
MSGAIEDDWDEEKLRSNSSEMEWPPKSGRRQQFPELDRAAWFSLGEARKKILEGQAMSLARLATAIGHRPNS